MRASKPLKRTAMKRSARPKMTAERRAAYDQPCMIRLPGCNGGGDTSCLCHYRLPDYCGTGIKPPDSMGAIGCNHCHDIVDGRAPLPDGYTREGVRLAHAEGVMRTQELMREMAA